MDKTAFTFEYSAQSVTIKMIDEIRNPVDDFCVYSSKSSV